MRYERTVSGCTRMCAAISLYDQSLRSVISGSSLADVATAARGWPPAITHPVPENDEHRGEGRACGTPVTQNPRMPDMCDRKGAFVT
ncbi:hypothetical protein GCM10010431_70100 [Streptomyces kunmingensis]